MAPPTVAGNTPQNVPPMTRTKNASTGISNLSDRRGPSRCSARPPWPDLVGLYLAKRDHEAEQAHQEDARTEAAHQGPADR